VFLNYNNGWTVRQAERFVLDTKKGQSTTKPTTLSPQVAAITDQLSKKFDTKVLVKKSSHGGQIVIHFKNDQDLDRIIKSL
jgi:hypothetical protein